MKHLLAVLTLVIGLTSLPATTFAKDKHHDDDRKDSYKDLRNDLNALHNHYDQVKDRVKNMGNGDRRLWEGLRDIRGNIDRIDSQVRDDRFDGRQVSYQIRQANDDLTRLQAQMEYSNKRRGGGYYRPY